MSESNNTKKVLITTLKVLLALLSYGFVVYKIYSSPDIESFWIFFENLGQEKYSILIIIIALMFVNWSLEAIKWKALMKPLQNVNFFKSFIAVWTGVTVGNVTPNRIGEFAGRILFLDKDNRTKGTSLTLYGDLAQFIVTLIFGIAGFALLSQHLISETKTFDNLNQIILVVGVSLTLICTIIYFQINHIIAFLKRFKIFQKSIIKISPDQNISFSSKFFTLLLSVLRYLVFTFQFYLALKLFDIEIGYYFAMISLASIYLATHVIPNIPFAEIGIRVSFSLLFIGLFTDSNTSILFSSLLIYIINVALPSLFGGFHLLKTRK